MYVAKKTFQAMYFSLYVQLALQCDEWPQILFTLLSLAKSFTLFSVPPPSCSGIQTPYSLTSVMLFSLLRTAVMYSLFCNDLILGHYPFALQGTKGLPLCTPKNLNPSGRGLSSFLCQVNCGDSWVITLVQPCILPCVCVVSQKVHKCKRQSKISYMEIPGRSCQK